MALEVRGQKRARAHRVSLDAQGAHGIEEGARVLLWSVDPQDWNSDKTPDQIAADIILHAAPGAILVVHDTKANTVEATRIVLSALAGRFNFVTVDELMHPVAPIPAENKDPATAIPVVTF